MTHRILVVDDDPLVMEILREMLLLKGYQVFATSDGEEALGMVESDHFDLVLTDLRMPDVSGLDIARRAKRKSRTIPVILITGSRELVSERELSEKVIDLMLSKPIEWKDLIDAVSGLLSEVT